MMDYSKGQIVNDGVASDLELRQNRYNYNRWWKEYYRGSHCTYTKARKRRARRADKMQLKDELFWDEVC